MKTPQSEEFLCNGTASPDCNVQEPVLRLLVVFVASSPSMNSKNLCSSPGGAGKPRESKYRMLLAATSITPSAQWVPAQRCSGTKIIRSAVTSTAARLAQRCTPLYPDSSSFGQKNEFGHQIWLPLRSCSIRR
eukprot:CAMPEP_0115125146 /NCGR_PEP_ID=MMETSP0227-20121206/48834_1 /TAXON_ID=89957 /ORGANISM="Polarella glacialis, Strain CCMP 1383" /LENGTH=132 /DNA_ID=CAMNT_0002528393 /DNA_START=124 /DNA_END=522 /DNA_ORIENTATION=-